MALNCQVILGNTSGAAGRSPPCTANILVFNPNAAAVIVTNAAMTFAMLGATGITQGGAGLAYSPSVPPIGPGQALTVPANGSITVGPFYVVIPSVAAANGFQTINPMPGAAVPSLDFDGEGFDSYGPGGGQPQFTILVGATVYGSDGSVNTAGTAPYFVDVNVPPPPGFNGGFAQFGAPTNSSLLAVPGVV